MLEPARLTILVSGRGSNAEAIVGACLDGRIHARVHLVLSNDPKAPALERAAARGIPTASLSHKGWESRDAFDEAFAEEVARSRPDWVVLAGFLRILGPRFLDRFPGRVLNIHPSLLPAFKGLNGHQRALDEGVRFHGCTVHFVDTSLDGGPIIAQGVVPVLSDDTEETLAARVLMVEHRLYPQVVAWAVTGRLRVEGRKVKVLGDTGPAPGPLIMP